MSLYCTFIVDRFFFGVPVDHIQEVVRHQDMSRVPLAPNEVSGLINLRGQIVTAIDLRRRLHLAAATGDRRAMNVLIKTPEGAVSLLVDQIEDVLEVPAEGVERPPETLQGEVRDLITGACKLKDRLLLLLDTQKTIEL
jgi:purine-binding chemotaxis protein CheW